MKKTNRAKPALTLGEFIMEVYDACEDRAAMIIWFALKSRLLVFPPRRRSPARRALGSPPPLHAGLRPLLARAGGPTTRPRAHRKVPVPVPVLMLR